MQVGFGLLQRDKRIFECYEDLADTVFYSEVGASRAILAANYTIDSLMLRYQGVDWTDKANWHCNAGHAPGRARAQRHACHVVRTVSEYAPATRAPRLNLCERAG